jgi:hypothetical protein
MLRLDLTHTALVLNDGWLRTRDVGACRIRMRAVDAVPWWGLATTLSSTSTDHSPPTERALRRPAAESGGPSIPLS